VGQTDNTQMTGVTTIL